jgi:K+-sensing histidine kinase KdpD
MRSLSIILEVLMKDTIKKYMPYAVVIFAIYIIVPLLFRSQALSSYVGVAWYFLFPATAAVTAAVYCSKYGLDFLFSLIAPIFFLPSMFLYYGGINLANIILLVVYLVAGIFGLFVGDIALGDKRRAKENQEKAEAEEMMLEANRRDELEKVKREQKAANAKTSAPQSRIASQPRSGAAQAQPKPRTAQRSVDDDFDYEKYLSDIDRTTTDSLESEIDDILNEYGKH